VRDGTRPTRTQLGGIMDMDADAWPGAHAPAGGDRSAPVPPTCQGWAAVVRLAGGGGIRGGAPFREEAS
jgi:hypothetical protein